MDDVAAVEAAVGAAPRLAVHTALTAPATYLAAPPGEHRPAVDDLRRRSRVLESLLRAAVAVHGLLRTCRPAACCAGSADGV